MFRTADGRPENIMPLPRIIGGGGINSCDKMKILYYAYCCSFGKNITSHETDTLELKETSI